MSMKQVTHSVVKHTREGLNMDVGQLKISSLEMQSKRKSCECHTRLLLNFLTLEEKQNF